MNKISRVLERILMKHIQSKVSLKSNLQIESIYLGRIRWGSLKSQILGAHLNFGKVWYIGIVLAKKTEFRVRMTKRPLWRPLPYSFVIEHLLGSNLA